MQGGNSVLERFRGRPFFKIQAALALGMAWSAGVQADTAGNGQAPAAAQPPQPVHVICLAEEQGALGERLQLLSDLNDLLGLGALFKNDLVDEKLRADLRDKVIKNWVWPLQDYWAKSIGTGFVVDEARNWVLTSYQVASSCPFNDVDGRRKRTQIAILSADGLRPIKAYGWGSDMQPPAGGTLTVPLPKFICKDADSACSRRHPDDLKKIYREAREMAQLRSEVKYWAPDLLLLKLDEPAQVQPVAFNVTARLAAGQSLRYAGFPDSSQKGAQGTANGVQPSARARATVQSATFGRSVEVDNSTGQIRGPDRKVAVSLNELTDANFEDGNGGAPIYDPTNGGVVGLLLRDLDRGAAQTGAKAVPAEQIVAYLKAAGVPFKEAAAVQPTPVPTPPRPEPPKTDDPVTWRIYAIAALILASAGIAGFLVWRQRQAKSTEGGVAAEIPLEPSIHKTTKPEYFATLRCTQGPLSATEVILPTLNGKDTVTVGKNPSMCQVVFPESAAQISSMHCRFSFDKLSTSLYVEDMKSTNGTYVNKRQLRQGEKVKLGNNDVVSLARPDSNIFVVTVP